MPCIDFSEIPKAHVASGEQDTFELFARDFFIEILKFKVLSEPSRGADGGKDILFEEQQLGTLSENSIIWLVSCKHKAHSGNSVTPDDEINISDRLKQFRAHGFIGFYSTLASSGLNARLDSYRQDYKIQIFDKEKIESFILGHKRYELFKRYFPQSYQKWFEAEQKHTPSRILSKYKPLKCAVCGTDLLTAGRSDHGIIGFAMHYNTTKTVDCYAACRGTCDGKMQAHFSSLRQFTAWDDVDDLLIPTIYLQRFMAILNQLQHGELEFEEDAFEKYKQILIIISQYIFRQQSDQDIKRIMILAELPEGI